MNQSVNGAHAPERQEEAASSMLIGHERRGGAGDKLDERPLHLDGAASSSPPARAAPLALLCGSAKIFSGTGSDSKQASLCC